jgi:two-component system response regulator HydG
MAEISILIVDDEPEYCSLLKSLLQQEGYSNIYTETNPLKVLPLLGKERVDLIIMDVYMPQMDGLVLLEKVNEAYPFVPVIMVTAVDDNEIALNAVKLGAYEYINKPPDTDRLFLIIKRALDQRLLELERESLRNISSRRASRKKIFSDIITESSSMNKVFELVEIFAPTNETILIVGETGTGKDLIAKKIHELSPRADKPYVVVNLASISNSLFESELFGHEKGSFTGATTEKIGYFEAANGGTIFLDEIGELPKELQGKLLRTIQYSEIYRIGNPKPIKLDIRIVAATNKDLVEAVNNKEFRSDLYYRLNRGFVHLPPLRERGEDVIALANYFLKIGNRTYKKYVAGFTEKVLDSLLKYSFPGNVRELENVILNAVAKTRNDELIGSLDISKEIHPSQQRLKLITIDEAVYEHIKNILIYTNGSVRKAANILGISERTLQRKLQQMRIDRIEGRRHF